MLFGFLQARSFLVPPLLERLLGLDILQVSLRDRFLNVILHGFFICNDLRYRQSEYWIIERLVSYRLRHRLTVR